VLVKFLESIVFEEGKSPGRKGSGRTGKQKRREKGEKEVKEMRGENRMWRRQATLLEAVVRPVTVGEIRNKERNHRGLGNLTSTCQI